MFGLVLDPRYKFTWFKAVGWPKQWIDDARKKIAEYYKTQYLPLRTETHTKIGSTTSTGEIPKVQPSSFRDLFTKQMRSVQKEPTDDDLKRYLAEAVVDPDTLMKERTGIDGVLGWWKVG